MKKNNLETVDWSSIPKPKDDGLTSHLLGMAIPNIKLKDTNNEYINISSLLGITIIFIYPITGRPYTPLPDHWDQIPGARGCTPQSCAFRDLYKEFSIFNVIYSVFQHRILIIKKKWLNVFIYHFKCCLTVI